MPPTSTREKEIAKYTEATRKAGRMDVVADSAATRIRKGIEGLIRRTLYAVLRRVIRTEPIVSKLDVADLESILIIPYGDAIGDMIAATPVWRAVKRRNPRCRIGVITSIRNESLIVCDSDVDRQYQFAGRRDFRNLSELRRARRDKYQLVLNLHFTNLTDYGLMSSYVGPKAIKITCDHPRREKYKLFFNHIGIRPRNSAHLSFHSLELLAEVIRFSPPLALAESWPSIAISEEKKKSVTNRVRATLASGTDKYLIIHSQAGTPFREWGIRNSIALATKLEIRYPQHTIFLTSAPFAQADVKKAIEQTASDRIQLFQTSSDLVELAAFIQDATLVVTPETSITHFASAVHTPVVVLMSNRDRLPIEWLPVATPARILAPSIGGEPVETISVSAVFEAATSLLNGNWTVTQSSLEERANPNPMLQREYADRPLEEFENVRVIA
jgi:ADP-heptose:LPS heptosyltransferase